MASLEELLAQTERGTPEGAAFTGVLNKLPGMGGFFGAGDYMARQGDQNRLRGKIAQQDESMAVIKDVLKQAGGDPEAAIKALLATGDPIGVEMASKLRALAPKPGMQQIGTGLYDPATQTVISPPEKPKTPGTFEGVHNVPGGYLTPKEGGGFTFTRTQKESEGGAVTVTEINDPDDPTKMIKIDAKTGRFIGRFDKPKAFKPLPGPLQKQLTEVSELADASERFKSTFKNEYGGKTVTGGLSNLTGRVLGDETGQAQWWQDYELYQSQVRNKLFGSALTSPEISAWNKSAINPRMDVEQIKLNLERRNKLEQTAISRLMKGASIAYDKNQIEAFTGRSIDGARTTEYIEIRTTPSGKRLGKKADGTIEEIK